MVIVEMSFAQLLVAVKQLSKAEKLKLSEAIWLDDMTIPLSHQNLVLDRKSRAKKDDDLMLDFDDTFVD